MVLEWEDHLLLLDAGMLFPNAEMPGVDSIVPDFEYLAERRKQVRGILLTHGHEDHIGALTYALQAAPAPVYGSRLTLGFARRRLQERGIKADLRTLRPGEPVEIGPFRVHPIRVAHSVIDSLALAIETPAGVVLASGDFKLDAEARPGRPHRRRWRSRSGATAECWRCSPTARTSRRAGSRRARTRWCPRSRTCSRARAGACSVSCFATSIPRIETVARLAAKRRPPGRVPGPPHGRQRRDRARSRSAAAAAA